jgi:hypothetical protein
MAAFAVLLVRVAEAPFVFALPFTALAAVMLAFMVAYIRSATIVEQDRITVRDAGIRRPAWRDITAIEIEENLIPNAVGGRAKTLESIVIYSRDGRRIVLPDVVGSRTMSVHHELRTLREIWERQRGEDWIPQPTAIEVAKEESAARERIEATILGAMGCAYTAMRITVFGALVVGLIALAAGKTDDLPASGWVFALRPRP